MIQYHSKNVCNQMLCGLKCPLIIGQIKTLGYMSVCDHLHDRVYVCVCVCVRSGSQFLQQLPARWLSEVLEEIKSSDPSSKLCATRRSAGIPFYIQVCKEGSEPEHISSMRSIMGACKVTYC